ncbi:hypothetical protein BRE01_52200 [Brevibacillus reuszeri]|uniref:Uncharacterized protein n=1 Tax=Brevibacillus reuszeri TaxID=54915 RepID=A0A0K9YK10_9BACL|nr:hypothetical protein ADS79_31260 [Brevibacillus reuszeri]GED71518.1 hypothetical protein BRE01_52200 [Brevibacillus reuszeri]
MVGETPDIRRFRTQVGHKTPGAPNNSGGEETGENTPASWDTSLEDSLYGSIAKAKPRPKWRVHEVIPKVDA